MVMKTKKALTIVSAIITLIMLSGNLAFALSTYERIFVTLYVEGEISMNLDDDLISQNIDKPEVEAFSELKEEGILVDKLRRGDSILWLFTKTE